VRAQQRTEFVLLGRSMLDKFCKQEGVDFFRKSVRSDRQNFQSATLEDLFANIGGVAAAGARHFQRRLSRAQAAPQVPQEKTGEKLVTAKPKAKTGSSPLTLKGLIPGMAVHYGALLSPVARRYIVGIVTTGKGVNHPYDRLRNTGKLRPHAGTLDRCRLG